MNKSAQTIGRDQSQDPKNHQDRENRPKHATPLSASVPVLPLRGAAMTERTIDLRGCSFFPQNHINRLGGEVSVP